MRVPRSQSTFTFVPGEHGGWSASLLYGPGRDMDADVRELKALIAGSRGSVIIGRRLAGAELRVLENYVKDIGISRDDVRVRRPGPR